jgi:glycosyltransferase involved in cell wall biosynthesis
MQDIEVSVVMPCLNEEKTVGICVRKAFEALKRCGIKGEVIVVDNGSTDNSAQIAESSGARVVHQPKRGYGNAYLKGFAEARGKYIVMGDSDNTYDFSELEKFVEPLRRGYDFVIGSRFKGKILPSAMPWLHQYIGNPILTKIFNLLFRAGISDAYCGMRSFTKEAYKRMKLRTTGMEFAFEMLIEALRAKLKIAEVPITYYLREGESKLHSFRDGWRPLRLMLLYSPTHLFLIPGAIMMTIGLMLLFALLRGPLRIGSISFDIHYMVLGSLLSILGLEVVNLGFYAKIYAVTEKLEEKDKLIDFLLRHFNLERGMFVGFILFMIGLSINVYILYRWVTPSLWFEGGTQLRGALLAMTLMVIGAQIVFSSFFLSILGMKGK